MLTGGKVHVKKESFIGMGSIIIDHITCENNTIIGAGAIVIENTLENRLYVGAPARAK